MITSRCGHHCGIDRGTEGHCPCPECKCPQAPGGMHELLATMRRQVAEASANISRGLLKPDAYERLTGRPWRPPGR